MSSLSLGALIRRQRELQERSLREVASAVGISGPYLSQIERGLRAPSDRVVESLARSLEMSAEVLKEIGAGGDREAPDVIRAIEVDESLTSSQRDMLLETYTAFLALNKSQRQGDR